MHEMPPKEAISKPLPSRLPPQVDNKNYKIPKKDKISDRDDNEIQIKKKVNVDSGGFLNMLDSGYNPDMRSNQMNLSGYDNRGMRNMPMNLGNDPYSNQPMNISNRYPTQNE